MSDRGTAEESGEASPVSGAEPTLAAAPQHMRAAQGLDPDVRAITAPSATREAPVKDWTGRDVAGRYRILERIGEGGMGVVYVAEHLTLRKKVAFKVIHPELAAHAELMARFKREALATGQLDHPHIAAAIDFDSLPDGGAFLVMPWVRGQSLQAEVDHKGKVDVHRAAELCSHIADALSAAHAVGIVHRDLKPDNVMIEQRSDGSESAKVLDFGVASLAGRAEGISVDARPLTQAGTVLGTPGYMSPEQASAGEVDHRTDLYALGVILWELCRGERLFSGTDITQIFAKQFREVPPPLELGHSAAAREMSALVTRLLAWDKGARPNSAGEVRDTLRRITTLDRHTLLPDRARAALVRHPRALPFLAGSAVVAIALWLFMMRKDEPTATVSVRPEFEDAVVIEPPTGAPQRAAEKPELREQPKEAPSPVVVRPTNQLPTDKAEHELREARDTLLNGHSKDGRRLAAKQVMRAHSVPRYLELAARFELATRCNDKKEVLLEIRALADPRLVPALERVAETPRRGCGFIRMSDCFACLRRELDSTIDGLARPVTQ